MTFFRRQQPHRPAAAKKSWENPAQVRDGKGGAVAGETGDIRDTRGLDGFRQGQGREDGGEVEVYPEACTSS
jgi:hypothetical protein